MKTYSEAYETMTRTATSGTPEEIERIRAELESMRASREDLFQEVCSDGRAFRLIDAYAQ